MVRRHLYIEMSPFVQEHLWMYSVRSFTDTEGSKTKSRQVACIRMQFLLIFTFTVIFTFISYLYTLPRMFPLKQLYSETAFLY